MAASLHIDSGSNIVCCSPHGPPGATAEHAPARCSADRCSEAAACACCRLQATQRPHLPGQQAWQCRLDGDVLASHLQAVRLGRMDCMGQQGMAAEQLCPLRAAQQHRAFHSKLSGPHLEGRPLYPIMQRSLSSTPPSVLARWCTTALRGNTSTCRHQDAEASAHTRCRKAVCMSQEACAPALGALSRCSVIVGCSEQ